MKRTANDTFHSTILFSFNHESPHHGFFLIS